MVLWIELTTLETEVDSFIPNQGKVAFGRFSFFFFFLLLFTPPFALSLDQWLGVTLEAGDLLQDR